MADIPTAETGAGVLAANGLTKTFRVRAARGRRSGRSAAPRPALVDVSLRLERGESVGVVGESGSGKSTLARCLMLLERPDTGSVVFDGRDLTALRGRELRRERRRIQIVFQDPYASLNPRLSVESALTEVLKVHELVPAAGRRARVLELLDLVGLPANALRRFPSDFSGGQRQRICIARALAAEPDVLIADEAVSALDVSIQAQILNLLQRLREELGLSLVFISHDLHVVRRIAPRVVVMFGGRIVESLPASVPLDLAVHPYTQALIAATPRLDSSLAAAGEPEGSEGAAVLALTGCPFRERCPHAMPVCTDVDPPFTDLSAGHQVACHYVAEKLAEGATT